MDSRECVRRAIIFQTPDRIPYFHRFLDATRLRYPDLVASLEARYPGDMAESCWKVPSIMTSANEADDVYHSTDEWGCVRVTGIEGLTGIATGNPLSDWQALGSYRWPDYQALGDWEHVPDILRQHPDKYHAAMLPGFNLFER